MSSSDEDDDRMHDGDDRAHVGVEGKEDWDDSGDESDFYGPGIEMNTKSHDDAGWFQGTSKTVVRQMNPLTAEDYAVYEKEIMDMIVPLLEDGVDLEVDFNLWGAGLTSKDAMVQAQNLTEHYELTEDLNIMDLLREFTVRGIAKLIADQVRASQPEVYVETVYQDTDKDQPQVASKKPIRVPIAPAPKTQTKITFSHSGYVRIFQCFVVFVFANVATGLAFGPIFAFRQFCADNDFDTEDNSYSVDLTTGKLTGEIVIATWKLLVLLPLYHLLFCGSLAVLTLLAKWLLIGKYHDGAHILWGWYFARSYA
jgi:hypothetical protein